MRSATSFFDKTLFRSQLKHTWPLWLGYTALWLFLVPVMLFSELSAYQLGYSAADASYLLLNTGVRGGIFISFFFGLFFAMLAFSHLTQSRATNGFHALPVRRETIFLTAYLTGLFCQLSTILVTFLLGAAVSAPLHLSFWSVTGAAMGSAMLESVFFYSFAALCMMMTGQILAAPVFYFVGNILVPGMEYLLRNFAGNFLYGYSGHTDVALGFLSPPLYMCSATSFLRNWDSILEKKWANLRSISEPARLRQPPPRSTGAAHARGRAQSIREERRIAAPPVLFALLWVIGYYRPFTGRFAGLYGPSAGVPGALLLRLESAFLLRRHILGDGDDVLLGKGLNIALAVLHQNGIDGNHVLFYFHFACPPSICSILLSRLEIFSASPMTSSKRPAIAS